MTPEQRAYLLSLDRDGEIRADDVVAAAEPENSPIHDLFEWDDEEAGARYRLSQARTLIRSVRVQYIAPEPVVREIRAIEYVRNPLLAAKEQGYMRTGVMRSQEEVAQAALRAELERVASMVQRTRMVAARLGLDAECEAGLRAILVAEAVA